MTPINEEREKKINRILEEYKERGTQEDVAKMFGMEIEDVAFVTQKNNYYHTRKIKRNNIRKNESITPCIFLDDFDCLDKYPIENFSANA